MGLEWGTILENGDFIEIVYGISATKMTGRGGTIWITQYYICISMHVWKCVMQNV